MDTLPTFAVVGHPNKGKSSIVATLAENDHIAISATPGTTRTADYYTFKVDGTARYVLVDTPGFQRPGALLKWLEKRAASASDRAAAVAEFVDAHQGDERFVDECELLRPLIEGAGILYVVDGAKPYGPEYELEMEILRWTGRPRMALINRIGDGDFEQEWRQALDQYFSIVRVFDALRADFEKRISLLRAFVELDEAWRDSLDSAVDALMEERQRRQARSAREIADGLVEVLTATERGSAGIEGETDAVRDKLGARLRRRIASRERAMFSRVQRIYRHDELGREEAAAEILDEDIFTRDNWEVFGLSRNQLAVTGAISGAAAGSGVDLALGGASLLLGASVGAMIGGAGGWLATGELARVRTIAGPLGGRMVRVGPVTAKNFPWVMLGRAWLHHHLVSERNHAHREAIAIAVKNDQHLMNAVTPDLRRTIGALFRKIGRGGGEDVRAELADAVESLLSIDPAKVDSN